MDKNKELVESIIDSVSAYKYDESKNIFELDENIEDHSLVFKDLGIIATLFDNNCVRYEINESDYSIKIIT
jgi:hypothetical protein